LVSRLVIELLIFGIEKHRWAFALPIWCGRRGLCRAASNRLKPPPPALKTTSPPYTVGVDGRPLQAGVTRMVRAGTRAILADRCALAVGAQAAEAG